MNCGSVPAKSKPSRPRTALRPPSQPTSQRAAYSCPPACATTPSSSCVTSETATPRAISTPSSAARSTSTDSTASRLVTRNSSAGPGSRNGRAARSTSAGSGVIPAKWPAPRGAGASSASGTSSAATPVAADSRGSIPRRGNTSTDPADRPRIPSGCAFAEVSGSRSRSSTSTEQPARPSSQARSRPTGPAPTITTSCIGGLLRLRSCGTRRWSGVTPGCGRRRRTARRR